MKGDFHYMSPERMNNTSRSSANDIWSVGATFVQMVTGQPLNHSDNLPQFTMNISQYKIFIDGKPYKKYLQTLNDDDLSKKIISRTLCIVSIGQIAKSFSPSFHNIRNMGSTRTLLSQSGILGQ